MEPLATMVFASAIKGAIQRNVRGRGHKREQKEIITLNLNEGMDDIIRILKSLETWG